MQSKKRNIDICLTPSLLDLFDLNNKKIVVIDVFRATSAICVFLNNGGERVFPVASIEDAENMKNECDDNYLFAAERNGDIYHGFTLGNSPLLYHAKAFNDTSLVITTTNGTVAISKSKRATNGIVLASFLNVTAVSDHISDVDDSDILIVCSGWKGRFCIEDLMLAGLLSNKLLSREQFYTVSDTVLLSQNIYNIAKADLFGFLSNSAYRKRMNLDDDIKYCLQIDTMKSVPIWTITNNEDQSDLFSGYFISITI